MTYTAHEIRAIAVAAKRDPRSVRDFLAGRSVKSTTRAAVTQAMRELGLLIPQIAHTPFAGASQ